MKAENELIKLFRYAAIFGNLVFVLWILYNGINEGVKGTIYEIISYIGLMLLLLLNTLLIVRSTEKVN
jgi:hypothetical protein